MNLITVALDAGHGQDSRNAGTFDTGATSAGRRESTLAFTLIESALFVAKRDFSGLIDIELTRDSATESAPLSGRTAEAKREGADCLISIHLNSADPVPGKPLATGTETFIRDGDAGDRRLATIVQSAAIAAFGLKGRGIKTESESQHSSLAILRGATIGIPACLLEVCFISNPSDVAAVFGDEARDSRIAFWSAVFRGILGLFAPSTTPRTEL